MKDEILDLSVIIPCYNEEGVLEQNVLKIKELLDDTIWRYEIILVDDFSGDRTVEIARRLAGSDKHIRLICHSSNMGRGKTVEDGIRDARGKIAGFLDIDLQVPAHYILPLCIELENGADVATAFRVYKMQISILDRYIASKVYRLIFTVLLRTGIKDPETGYKFFNREKILPVLDEIKDKYWFWDTEVMVRSYLRGYKIKEMKTLCMRDESNKTTVKLFRDSIRHLKNIIRFKKEVDQIRKGRSK
ncbi:MAG: glycosyltransferase family 2 protein [Candidatus Omnitrophota bacterium]|jgi:hypothetical protein